MPNEPAQRAGVPSAPVYRGPPPVTMFRAATPPPALLPASVEQEERDPSQTVGSAPERRPYSIVTQSQRDAAQFPAWNPANLDPVVAPPMVPGGRNSALPRANLQPGQADLIGIRREQKRKKPHQRSALRRILQDTRTGLTYDVPEAIADAMPWVDQDRKNEPFDIMLARVAEDLNRAAQNDPEWALGAQRELRDLSKRLDRLPEPPPTQPSFIPTLSNDPESDSMGAHGRPFRPRPIWPGTSGRPEAQVRPVTIVTETGLQAGPRTGGVQAAFVADAEDIPAATRPQRQPAARQGSRRIASSRR
jgi:hypothetical protein